MKDLRDKPVTGLTPIEIACLTAGVPCSGTPEVDRIITLSLRVRTAQMVLQGYASNSERPFPSVATITDALNMADIFLTALSRESKDD